MVTEPSVKNLMLAAFGRFFYEDTPCWTQSEFHAIINPRGEKHELTDPDIVEAIQELEQEGYIRFIGNDPCFIEVLKTRGPQPW